MCGPKRNRQQEQLAQQAQDLSVQERNDSLAAQAKLDQQNAEKISNIKKNSGLINSQFDQFDDNFYKQRQQADLNYYLPQLDKQFSDAKTKTALSLGQQGLSSSSSADKDTKDLSNLFSTGYQKIQDQANTDTQNLRSDVEGRRDSLLNEANNNQNFTNINDYIGSNIAAVQAPKPQSELGDIFANVTGNLNTYAKANPNAVPNFMGQMGTSLGNLYGSAKVIH